MKGKGCKKIQVADESQRLSVMKRLLCVLWKKAQLQLELCPRHEEVPDVLENQNFFTRNIAEVQEGKFLF